MSAPAFQAVITSVGVSAPGMIGTPRSCAAAMVPRSRPGLTMNAAPASMQRRAASASSTVPAPTTARSPSRSTSERMTAVASGTVIVISKIEMPPAITASAARIASSGDGARTTGTMPTSSTRMQMSARRHRSILVPAPFIARITSANVAIVVSPGVDIASAPCATPHSSAHCGSLPASSP